ncbi:uncharacterized protein LOC130973576 isoform X1 [Arachis stenosperma]|uniref:uncharacterized protein LOC130973576 isoform X1 n=1 Tax=Arachis stenosperma TaxID=217475 RepID=UPI0025AB614A|nr:uncharacterized protein LOC130973576 isoform X1 [Arachis stenosperma]XP_057754155.1 uncharacterized protein LOC130973576 isoform X1 [Arachis stenosperma]
MPEVPASASLADPDCSVEKMSNLYRKLYDKYTKLKNRKLLEFDELNKEQEVKFMKFLSAAEELIEDLKNENVQLHDQLNELRSEVSSVRLAKLKEVADYQNLFLEEKKKNEALTEEVEKLLQQQQERTSRVLSNSKVMIENGQLKAISDSSERSSTRMTRKRSWQAALENETSFISAENREDDSVVRMSMQNVHKEMASGKKQLLESCTTVNDKLGVASVQSDNCNWLIQELFEHALGMKLSADYQTGTISLSALHQSSGYSFTLTWISKAPEEEAELLYHVLSLGTFERVAPEWMREDIIFSPTMCSIFFERVSHVIKLHH